MAEAGEFYTYTIPRYKGIDDLIGEYAWVGNSQGDESVTNNIKAGEGSGGWMSYMFKDVDKTDQAAINTESARRKKKNADYIDELKATGEYGKPMEPITVRMKHYPIFDGPFKK